MKLVIIESPYGDDDPAVVAENERYLNACLHDSLMRGEAPFASHGLYTRDGVLDDRIPKQRLHGIAAGLEWGRVAALVAIYTDRGVSSGMRLGKDRAQERGQRIVERRLGPPWSDE